MIPVQYFGPVFSLLSKAFVKGVENVDSKKIRKASKFIRKWTSVIDPIDLNQPGTWVEAIRKTVSNLGLNDYLLKEPSEWLQEHDVKRCYFIEDIMDDFYVHLDRQPVPDIDNDYDDSFFRLSYNDELMDVYVYLKEDNVKVYILSYEKLDVFRDFFWNYYGIANFVATGRYGNDIEIDRKERYIGDDVKYIGPLEKKLDVIEKLYDEGKTHSILLDGEPGNGKTTFCVDFSKRIDGRLVIVPGTTLDRLSMNYIWGIRKVLSPDCILVDDFERIEKPERSLNKLSDMSENIKITFYTTNDKDRLNEALIRPGRIDQIFNSDVTDRENMVRIQNYFLDLFDMDKPSSEVRKKLVKLHKQKTGAYVREAVERANVLGWDHSEVFSFEDHQLESDE